jgi:hypothetical protein
MVFRVKGNKALTERVTLRLPPDEKERLQLDAEIAGLSVSELVRCNYFGRPVIAHADVVMVKELRRLGGLMKHAHVDSGGLYSDKTSDAIAAITRYINQLAKAK